MYLVFEGIEGSGKSVQIKLLYQFLVDRGYSVFVTKEPGSTLIGTEIRAILLNSRNINIHKSTEIFLYLADRSEHIDKVVKPNLNSFDFIISDRSFYSTLVYQGFGRGIDLNFLNYLNNFVVGDTVPDKIFLLDCPVDIGLKRALTRESLKDIDESRFENENFDFHKRVRDGYLNIANSSRENWFIIDSSSDVDTVFDSIKRVVVDFIDKGGN